jgi:preprotein translocase subunit SecA
MPEPRRSGRRFGPRWFNWLRALGGPPSSRRLGRAVLQLGRIRHWEAELDRLSDAELLTFGSRCRGRVRGGESLDAILPEVFGAVCVAARRTIRLRPFDSQLVGGVVLHRGALAELATGEGKTLVAVLPVCLNALPAKGAHVTTVNDYLAKRDAEWTGPVYRALGLSVGVLQAQMSDDERARAYGADVTYGTASEFGFDFLRDRLKIRSGAGAKALPIAAWRQLPVGTDRSRVLVQRGHHFALVDEADNIFLDEARTPLVIGGRSGPASEDEQEVYRWADGVARRLVRDRHYTYDERKQQIELTREGLRKIRWSGVPARPGDPPLDKLCDHVERSLHAHQRFRRDQHYMVERGKVEIIDENTGRRMPDRQWGEGLHQAVEVKEGLPAASGEDHLARVTYQSYFRLYDRLAGMTGTAAQNWLELRLVYKLPVVCVPTNRPVIREQLPDRVFPTEHAKFAAVVAEVTRLTARGRAVLIGTRSVEKSEKLSRLLRDAGLEHQVLNARHHGQEAQVVAEAGRAGRVTIATNMAGRGTDIKPDPAVLAAGGLHVLGTERHESLRIDRQLAGRAGRQGDPGSAQFFLSLDDELLEALGAERLQILRQSRRPDGGGWQGYLPLFRRAQRRTERRHHRDRVDVMMYEKRRREVLDDLCSDPYVD